MDDQQRDYAEEAYNRDTCPMCDGQHDRGEPCRGNFCPACGRADVVTGLDGVLLETHPEVRRHVCNVGRVTIGDNHE